MKIASFTMLRNEAPILNPFLDQIETLFDHQVVVDHESTDESCDKIRNRSIESLHLFHLKSSGYPQSELATFFTKWVFSNTDADWLFYLDCDEFLPFGTRDAFENALSAKSDRDVVYLQWRNICPRDLSGINIFGSKFDQCSSLSPYPKFAISRRAFERGPDLKINQGYHGISGLDVSSEMLSPSGLYHIPIQSKLRFATKLKASGERLLAEKSLLSKGLGGHWISLYRQLQNHGLRNFDFRSTAINYPTAGPTQIEPCNFDFDYVRSAYNEDAVTILMQMIEPPLPSGNSVFHIYNDNSTLLFTSHDSSESTEDSVRVPILEEDGADDKLFAPLFSLPVKLPMTAWAGHIPFLFVLMKLLRPNNYVDLGVHYGASLIAAATAAATYKIPTQLYGVDTWSGDEHAGYYDGEDIYRSVASVIGRHFKNVRLLRSLFDDAARQFLPGTVDLLHIDGLHTYDAVRHDFETWFPKMAPSGVIMFHDTRVIENGFGVYKFWHEVSQQFETLEFGHSFGLGIAFLNSKDPRIQSLIRIATSPHLLESYRIIVEGIGSTISARMKDLEDQSREITNNQVPEQLLAQLRAYESEIEAFRLDQQSKLSARVFSRLLM